MAKALVAVILVIFCTHLALPNDFFDISFTRAECIDHNETLCKNHYCYVKRFRNNSNLFNMGCELVYSPILFYRATVYYKFGVRYKKMFLFNLTGSICDVVKAQHKQGDAINMFLLPIKKYSNAIHPCPYQGKYRMVDIPATAINLPAGEYRLDFRIFNNKNQTLAFPRLYLTIKGKGTNVLAMG